MQDDDPTGGDRRGPGGSGGPGGPGRPGGGGGPGQPGRSPRRGRPDGPRPFDGPAGPRPRSQGGDGPRPGPEPGRHSARDDDSRPRDDYRPRDDQRARDNHRARDDDRRAPADHRPHDRRPHDDRWPTDDRRALADDSRATGRAAVRPTDNRTDHRGPGRPGEDGPRPLRADQARRARRRTILVASFAVLIMLLGLGVVGGAYYVDGIAAPDELTFPESTTVFYSDGKTVLAKLGEVTRYNLSFDEMNDAVKESIVASEDKTFWDNSGVDFASVVRAAWNNFTGGEQQGGSTITQQYARLAFQLKGATYSRKVREAILAYKLDQQLSKEKILEFYLNAVPFGRNTYGIEAAALAYFGKTANKKAPAAQQLTKAEAMLLVAMVKQPEGDKDHPGYDPTFSPAAKKQSVDRWNYVRQQMRDLGYLTPAEDAALKYPGDGVHQENINAKAGYGMERPAALVVNHVLSELSHADGPFHDMSWQQIRDGGYKIITTIDARAQNAAEKAADETVKGSYMYGQPKQLQAALVAVEPGTGRVLAYYGGHDGKGGDYAGIYFDEKGEGNGFGRYPAGSSFKVYTLAAALQSGISLNSYWESRPHDMPGRTGSRQIRNASSCPTGENQPCSLLNSTIASLNVPFYEVTASIGPRTVLAMARAAGIDYMWNDARQRQSLVGADVATLVPSQFDTILGIGQYPVTVLDHANGVATMAAGGFRATAHFVTRVLDRGQIVYAEKLPDPKTPRILSPEAVSDLTYAMSKVSAANLSNGWDSAGKTGTWELSASQNENADAWMVGFTRRMSAAVWVGNRGAEKALRDKSNDKIYGAGLPASIWRAFITNATKAMNLNKKGTDFGNPSLAGDTNPPGSVPPPTPPDNPGDKNPICRFFFCPPGRR